MLLSKTTNGIGTELSSYKNRMHRLKLSNSKYQKVRAYTVQIYGLIFMLKTVLFGILKLILISYKLIGFK